MEGMFAPFGFSIKMLYNNHCVKCKLCSDHFKCIMDHVNCLVGVQWIM